MLVGIIDTGVDGVAPRHRAELRRRAQPQLHDRHPAASTGRARRTGDPARTRPTSTRTATARTWPARSPRRSTASASRASPRRPTIVNLRAGQDSGYFFLQPTVDALTYAGDNGIDVVNMSYYIDPWLFNCTANPADSPAEQAEQRTIIKATQRALRYARDHGVTLVSAAGNQSTDLGDPVVRRAEPRLPAGRRPRRGRRQRLHLAADRGRRRDRVTRSGRAAQGVLLDYGIGRPTCRRRAATPATRRRRRDPPSRAPGLPESLAQPAASTRTGADAGSLVRDCDDGQGPACTTSTCKAPRWPRPTRPASRR